MLTPTLEREQEASSPLELQIYISLVFLFSFIPCIEENLMGKILQSHNDGIPSISMVDEQQYPDSW
jgi:hypothetical protein